MGYLAVPTLLLIVLPHPEADARVLKGALLGFLVTALASQACLLTC